MATVASLDNLKMNNVEFTASTEWTLGLGGKSRNAMRNITGTPISTQEVPETDVCEGQIRLENKLAVRQLIASNGFTLVARLKGGDNGAPITYRLTNAVVTNKPNLNTDGGVIDLTVEGIGGFL